MKKILSYRSCYIAQSILAASMLGAAFFFQYVIGLAPCDLCIWQRWPYAGVVALGIIFAALPQKNPFTWLGFVLIGLTFWGDSGIALYHTGIEQHWWESSSACTSSQVPTNMEDFMKFINEAPVVRCDEPAWSLFGISMAAYNMMGAFGMGILAFACPTFVRRYGKS